MKKSFFNILWLIVFICILNNVQGNELQERIEWMDNGVPFNYKTINEELVSFCFNPNSSLAVRFDPLTSSMQPYMIRLIGYYTRSDLILNRISEIFIFFQKYFSTFFNVFWLWSDIRVVVKSHEARNLKFQYYQQPGYLCQYLLRFRSNDNNSSFPYFTGYELPSIVSKSFDILFNSIFQYCSSCSSSHDTCAIHCEHTSNDACMIILSPFSTPCLHVLSQEDYIFGSTYEYDYVISFSSVLSFRYVTSFIMGLFFFTLANRLSVKRSFHYLLGASLGIILSIVLALYIIYKQARSAFRSVPGSGLIEYGTVVATYALPATVLIYFTYIKRCFYWAMDALLNVWTSKEIFGIPHLGKAYFILFGAFGILFVWWYQWCASDPVVKKALDQPEEEDYLEEDEYVYEKILTQTQTQLYRLVKCFGVIMLLHSTSNFWFSILILCLVSFRSIFHTFWLIFYFWYNFENPGRHRHLISLKEYEKQGRDETEKALRELQEYLSKNPLECEKVKEHNEIRIRRFAHGRNHMASDTPPRTLKHHKSKWYNRCNIQ